jgi:hypothetical protein
VTSADGHSPAGHMPFEPYETSPLDSHDGHWDPQHACAMPVALHVPFGHSPATGGEYPLDSQYPASGGDGEDGAEDEHAAATKAATVTQPATRTAYSACASTRAPFVPGAWPPLTMRSASPRSYAAKRRPQCVSAFHVSNVRRSLTGQR